MPEKLGMHVKLFLPRIGLIPMPKRLDMHVKPNFVFGGGFKVFLASFACQAWTTMPVIALAQMHIELACILSLSFECNFIICMEFHGIGMEFTWTWHGIGMQLAWNWVYSHASLQRAELEAEYSCVRPCVRPPPRGSSKHMLLHHTV